MAEIKLFVLLLAAASCSAASSHRSSLNHPKRNQGNLHDDSGIYPDDEGDTIADSTLYRDDVVNLNPSNSKAAVIRAEFGREKDSSVRLAKHQDPIIVAHRGTAKEHSVSYREPTISVVRHTTVSPVGGYNSPAVPVVSQTPVTPATLVGHAPAVPVATFTPAVYAVSHIPPVSLVTPAPAAPVLGHARAIPIVGHSHALHTVSPAAAHALSSIPAPTVDLSNALFVEQVPSVTGVLDNSAYDSPKKLVSHVPSSSSYGEPPKISTKSHNSEYSISTSYGAPPPLPLPVLAPKVSATTNVFNQVFHHIPQDNDGLLAYHGSQRVDDALQSIPLVLSTPGIVNNYQYAPFAPLAPVKSQYHAQDELGQYSFGYHTSDATREETRNVYGHVRGSFSYVDSNGLLQSQYYVADDNGFRVAGTNLPLS